MYGKELLLAGSLLVILVAAGIRDASSSAPNWPDIALGIAIVGAVTWFVARKPLKAFRKLASFAKSASMASNGISGAPSAFAQLIPGREEAEDLFSGVLNVGKPRPIKWSWTERVAVAIAALVATVAIWIAYEGLKGNHNGEAGGIALLAVILYTAARLRFPIVPALSKLRLLRFAEVTVGRVVCLGKTTRGGIGSNSLVLYAFLDGAGRAFIGQGIDYTDRLATGAPVVIFYEALDPTRNVALECSRFTVKVPDAHLTSA
jgi:hypothetical protein